MVRPNEIREGQTLRVRRHMGSFALAGELVVVDSLRRRPAGTRVEVRNRAGARFSFNCVRGALRFDHTDEVADWADPDPQPRMIQVDDPLAQQREWTKAEVALWFGVPLRALERR